jgi:hypothetical protein
MNNDKIFVVAGTHEQFTQFVRRKATQLWDGGNTSVTLSNFVYVSGPEVFRGFNSVHGYFVGTFRQRKDIEQILEMIRIINTLSYDHKFYP